jgi:hypothetical protein
VESRPRLRHTITRGESYDRSSGIEKVSTTGRRASLQVDV